MCMPCTECNFEDSPIEEVTVFNWVFNSEQRGKEVFRVTKVVPFEEVKAAPDAP